MHDLALAEAINSSDIRRAVAFYAGGVAQREGLLHEREDIEAELTMHLVKSFRRFDPLRAAARTFADRVLRHSAWKIRKRLRTRSSLLRFVHSLPEDMGSATLASMSTPQCCEQRLNLALDIERVVARLEPPLRDLCRLLWAMTVTEAAEQLGISRSTAYRRRRLIRAAFERAGLEHSRTGSVSYRTAS